MTGYQPDLLLVRPSAPAAVTGRLRVGVPEVYVLAEVGAPDEPVLASCTVVRLDDTLAEIVDVRIDRLHRGCGHEQRLLDEVMDVLRAAGVRQVVPSDGPVVEL